MMKTAVLSVLLCGVLIGLSQVAGETTTTTTVSTAATSDTTGSTAEAVTSTTGGGTETTTQGAASVGLSLGFYLMTFVSCMFALRN